VKDVGVRIARQKLLRYRQPEPAARRWRRVLVIGLAAWAVWALLVSDHSVARLLRLKTERDRLAGELVKAKRAQAEAEKRVPSDKPTLDEAERLLRERHTFARDGEVIYIIGDDSTAKQKSR
jgi:cell division protein FtsB